MTCKPGRWCGVRKGIFARVPGLGFAYKLFTIVVPLGRGQVVKKGKTLYVK
ncbi:MAG: hypothetical protein ABR609_14950 [Acidimicrobiia bacterium]